MSRNSCPKNTAINKTTKYVLIFLIVFFAIVIGVYAYSIIDSFFNPFRHLFRATLDYVLEILPLALLLPGFVLFIKKKKLGWLLLLAYMSFFMVQLGWFVVFALAYGGIDILGIVMICLFVLAYYAMMRLDVRQLYKIDMGWMLVSMIFPSIIAFFLLYETY